MRFAIVIRKQKIDNPWQNYRWKPIEVIPDIGQFGNCLLYTSPSPRDS